MKQKLFAQLAISLIVGALAVISGAVCAEVVKGAEAEKKRSGS